MLFLAGLQRALLHLSKYKPKAAWGRKVGGNSEVPWGLLPSWRGYELLCMYEGGPKPPKTTKPEGPFRTAISLPQMVYESRVLSACHQVALCDLEKAI